MIRNILASIAIQVRSARFCLIALLIQGTPLGASATEYVWSHLRYAYPDNFVSDDYNVTRDFAKQQLCQSGRFNCVLTVTGPLQYYNYMWFNQPVALDFDYRDDAGKVYHGSATSFIYFQYYCPALYTPTYVSAVLTYRCARDRPVVRCLTCEGKPNAPSSTVGNPIDVLNRSKIQVEVDYRNVSGTLSYVRTYQSDAGRWTSNFDRAVVDWNAPGTMFFPPLCYYDQSDPLHYCYRYASLPKTYNLELRRGASPPINFDSGPDLKPSADLDDRITPLFNSDGTAAGWSVQNTAEDSAEMYNADGRLKSITRRGQGPVTFEYSGSLTPVEVAPYPGLLVRIQDVFGSALELRYDANGQVKAMVDPDGHETQYSYDSTGKLTDVTYPDGQIRTYVYNEASNVVGSMYRALTGIIDENRDRFATFTYTGGIAAKTYHDTGIDSYSVIADSGSTRQVTGPMNERMTYTVTNYLSPVNTLKIASISRPSANGTGSAVVSYSYDANFNVSQKIDFDGSRTNFSYDLARNLETSRTEAYGTLEARTISTAWHPTLRVPVAIAEPKRLITFTYDTQGRMLTRTEQATTDLNGGQGLNPTLTGQPRTRAWTYNEYGQMLTETGPRTDVTDTTTYTYDVSGNLATIVNAKGHVTAYSNYDNSGRVGRIVAPNGLVTELSYTPRGWLASRTVSDGTTIETTSFDYDGVGQLKKATFPDGSWLAYTYDKAHRLIAVADSANNSVTYTLDNAGNRLSEKTTDLNGTLTRQITRVYDVLNNMKQATGVPQ